MGRRYQSPRPALDASAAVRFHCVRMNIDDVDWGSLEHAYGEATDVPRVLRALRSESPGDRRGALHDLYGCLCHQGTVYSATAAAVPFLVDALLDPADRRHPALLRFIGDVAHGYGEAAGSVREALGKEAARIASLLADPDPDTRSGALWALSLPAMRAAAGAVEALAASDPVPAVRAAAWRGLGEIDRARVPDHCADASGAVRLAWALSSDAPGRSAEIMARLRDGESWPALQAWTAKITDDSPLARAAPLLDAGAGDLLYTIADLLERESDEDHAMAVYGLLLGATFPVRAEDAFADPPIDVGSLDDLQRRVLEAIARSDAAWKYGNLRYALMRHGVAYGDGRDDLCAALGVQIPQIAIVLCPRQVRAAAMEAERVGRAEWLDVPFVFMSRDDDRMAEEIPEDPDDFPPEVMRAAGYVARALLHLSVRRTRPMAIWAFYPKITAAEAERALVRLGYEVLPPDLSRADDDLPADLGEIDDDDDDDDDDDNEEGAPLHDEVQPRPCVPYPALSDELRSALEGFVEALDARGFSEVRASYRSAQQLGEAGVHVTPLALGRLFGDRLQAEVGFHVEETEDDGELEAYVRVALVDPESGPLVARLLWEDPAPLFAALASVDLSRTVTEVLLPLARSAQATLLETAQGLLSAVPPPED